MSNLLEQLKRHEGLRLKPYKCTAGKLTIGYGRNIEDKGISKVEAEDLLYHDIKETERELRKKLPLLMDELNTTRSEVLVNMAFNMGVHGLLKFKKMIKALDDNDYDEACRQMMDSRWAVQVGKRAVELAEQMRTGVYK